MSTDQFNPEPGGLDVPAQRLLASFGKYGEAQGLVDRMSDDGFPVEHVPRSGCGCCWSPSASVCCGARLFGFVAHLSPRGRRDFSGVQSRRADRYDVYVDADHALQADRFRSAA